MVSRSPVFLSEFGRVSVPNLFGAGTCPDFDTKNGGIYNSTTVQYTDALSYFSPHIFGRSLFCLLSATYFSGAVARGGKN